MLLEQKKMAVVDVLKAAREVISVSERWCQRAHARTKAGHEISPLDKAAKSFCAEGAIFHVCDDLGTSMDAIRVLENTADSSMPYLNDLRGHEAVLNVYDKAIRRLEANP